MDDSRSESQLEEFLARLSRGVLGADFDPEQLPSEFRRFGEALVALRDQWLNERTQTVEQAVAALERSQELYHRDRERAEVLELAHSKLRDTQAQLVHASKLASLGTLAAGVAHEINQPLTVILSLAELIDMHPDDLVSTHSHELEKIGQAAERVATIVNNIRTFGRQDEFRKTPTPVNEPLERALEFFETRFQVEGITVIRDYRVDSTAKIELDANRCSRFLSTCWPTRETPCARLLPQRPSRLSSSRPNLETARYSTASPTTEAEFRRRRLTAYSIRSSPRRKSATEPESVSRCRIRSSRSTTGD